MSKDGDSQKRRWLSLGYGGKRAPKTTWRYWEKSKGCKDWIISAPNGLAEFSQRDKTVFYEGVELFTEKTQWLATWRTLAYFYMKVIPKLPPPPISDR